MSSCKTIAVSIARLLLSVNGTSPTPSLHRTIRGLPPKGPVLAAKPCLSKLVRCISLACRKLSLDDVDTQSGPETGYYGALKLHSGKAVLDRPHCRWKSEDCGGVDLRLTAWDRSLLEDYPMPSELCRACDLVWTQDYVACSGVGKAVSTSLR